MGQMRVIRQLLCLLNGLRYISDDRVTFQPNLNSCGQACVQMVLRDYNLLDDGEAANHRFRSGAMSMLDMAQWFEQYGLKTRGLRLDAPADLVPLCRTPSRLKAVIILESERLFPYQLWVRLGRFLLGRLGMPVPPYRHWVVIDEATPHKVRVRDPLLGLIELSHQRFQRLWDGFALLVGSPFSSRAHAEGGRETPGPVNGEAASSPDSMSDISVEKETLPPVAPVASSPPVILKRVSRVYQRRVWAVRQVSLQLHAGEVFCLLGPNGAGKTTLVKMMTGILPPSSGQIILHGIDLWAASEAERLLSRRSIGYMPERLFLYERLTPREYLLFVGQLYGLDDQKQLEERIIDALQTMALGDKMDTRIGALSHGMRRKIAFIAAQLHEPSLLLLDEPTQGLDPRSARLVKDQLRVLRDRGHTVLMTTHVLEIAERIADRVGILDQGTLLFVGTLAELRELVGHPQASLEDLFLKLTDPQAEGIPEPDMAKDDE
ncbi:MAG: ATP-binding cassette domain-containing protein [Acidobacteria bacterium]|nr:MAG: ATP-binding cassette domain-containing protein [Acidobacteriota bacterium]